LSIFYLTNIGLDWINMGAKSYGCVMSIYHEQCLESIITAEAAVKTLSMAVWEIYKATYKIQYSK